MGQAQQAGVQAQAFVGGEGFGVGVEAVAEQRMADGEHVHAQLVRTAGDRRQLDPAPAFMTLDHTPEGQGVAAVLEVHHVTRLGRRVVAQRQFDAPAVQFRQAPAKGGIGFLGLAVVELAGQLAVAVGVAGEHHQAGGFPVQAVDDAGLGIAVFLQAGDQAVLVVIGAAGHRQQQGGLVDHQQGVILVNDSDLGQRHSERAHRREAAGSLAGRLGETTAAANGRRSMDPGRINDPAG
ncbi:Uncharacterised protein [Acinetobacter baumannii]|nr:Uncharacterised protein [Acinetobacter baumannii]